VAGRQLPPCLIPAVLLCFTGEEQQFVPPVKAPDPALAGDRGCKQQCIAAKKQLEIPGKSKEQNHAKASRVRDRNKKPF